MPTNTAHNGYAEDRLMPMTHILKTWPHEHDAVADGSKTFEVRDSSDRSFGVGDTLLLRRWDPGPHGALRHGAYETDAHTHTSNPAKACTLCVRVTHILQGGRFGLPSGICVMSIKLETD